MNIFDRMSQRALKITSKNSDGNAIYTFNLINISIEVVLNKDVNIVDDFGQVFEKITTIDLSASVDVVIGGIFAMQNGDTYIIDAKPISNDGSIQVVSVVKQ